MPDALTDEHHDWMSSFFGVDTRQDPKSSGGGILGAIGNAVSGVAQAASSAVASVEHTVGETVDAAKQVASSAVKTVETTASAAVEKVEHAGASVAEGLKKAAKSVEHAAGSAVNAGGTHVGNTPPPDTPADPAKVELYRDDAKDQASGTPSDIHEKINEGDIHQGQVGDCFVLSSVGEIAKLRPDVIKSMIQDNHDGTYTVTLHQKQDGYKNLWGLFDGDYKEVKVTVNADTPAASVNRGAGDAKDGDKKVDWPLILEKAYTQVNGGYSKVTKGGDPADALGQLTGKKAESKSTSDVTLDDIKKAAASGKPMVFNSPDDEDGVFEKIGLFKSKKLPFGMHGNHAYMFEGLQTGADGKVYVQLKNPWGHDDPQLIPYDELNKAVSSVSTGEI